MNRKPAQKRLPAAKRRATTVQAVLDLAAAGNPADITTSDIARRMHITQGALFRHFPTKAALWLEVIEWVTQRALMRVEETARTAKSPLQALEAEFTDHIFAHARHAGAPRIILGELQRAGDTQARRMVRNFLDEYIERLQTLVEQGKECGEIIPTVDGKAAATLFVGMIRVWFSIPDVRKPMIDKTKAADFRHLPSWAQENNETPYIKARALAMIAVLVPLAFIYPCGAAIRAARPGAVTVATVENQQSRLPCSASALWRPPHLPHRSYVDCARQARGC